MRQLGPPKPHRPSECALQRDLTNRDHRHLLAIWMAGSALGAGIQSKLAVHFEEVLVMAVLQENFQAPSPVGLANHRMLFAVPVVKLAEQTDPLSLRRPTDKDDRFDDFLRFEPFE